MDVNVEQITNLEIVTLIESKFEEKLKAKTGWGKNEVLYAFKDAAREASLELLDKYSK